MKDFSDIYDEKDIPIPLEGKKVKVDDILGIPLVIITFNRRYDGKYNDGIYYIMQYMMDGKIHVSNTQSKVMQSQLDKYEKDLPFTAKVVKIGNYHTLKGVKYESMLQNKTAPA